MTTILRTTARTAVALLASLLALLTGPIMLGAYFPAIPKVGVIGPVLGGQYPFHMALFALTGLCLALLAWRGRPHRWGRAVTVITAVSTAAALLIGGVQLNAALGAGAQISARDILTELAYPGATPDRTETYATRDDQNLDVDIYLPEDTGNAPAIILAHAGGFHVFDKSDLRGTGRWLADHGVAVFAVDYRLATADRPTWDKAPQDLVTSLRWIREHADTFGIDRDRIAMGGMSAGGTLAMNTAYRLQNGTITATDGATPEPPATVVGFYPGTDVTRMWQRDVAGSRNAAELFTGGTPDQYPDRYREVSPLAEVRPGLQPTLMVVGDRDRSAPPATVRELADALHGAGVDTTVKELPFAEHAFDDAYGSLTSQTSRQLLLDFLTDREPAS
ncbi:alpha/beta hydrolase [Streptomyces harbinensis]|uniref:alpha/beta hydrolase n=1 Tax=Streptomyces harbinensis TaxID=1176198 RepID=UPI003396042D